MIQIQKWRHLRAVALAVILLLLAEFLLMPFQRVAVAQGVEGMTYGKQMFRVSAYYSPLPGQKKYLTGDYHAELRLNGKGLRGASGLPVFAGMIAAPKTYPFGTQIYIPALGLGTVADRGGAIVQAGMRGQPYDRLDIWMGYGDKGLQRALQWGKRNVEGTVLQGTTADETIDFLGMRESILRYKQLMDVYGYREISDASTADSLYGSFPGYMGKSSTGLDVNVLQAALKRLGYFEGSFTGAYDKQTIHAVYTFQKDKSIITDPNDYAAGYFGVKTRSYIIQGLLAQNISMKDLLEDAEGIVELPKVEEVEIVGNEEVVEGEESIEEVISPDEEIPALEGIDENELEDLADSEEDEIEVTEEVEEEVVEEVEEVEDPSAGSGNIIEEYHEEEEDSSVNLAVAKEEPLYISIPRSQMLSSKSATKLLATLASTKTHTPMVVSSTMPVNVPKKEVVLEDAYASEVVVVTESKENIEESKNIVLETLELTANEVRTIQKKLKSLGFYEGPATGNWGPLTTEATKVMQERAGLQSQDGQYTEETATYMEKIWKQHVATWGFTQELDVWDEGDAVEKLQEFLYKQGYYNGEVNGVFGTVLEEALYLFQRDHQILSARSALGAGRLGPTTIQKVNDVLFGLI